MSNPEKFIVDPDFMLIQLELFEKADRWKTLLSPIWDHPHMQVIRTNDMLREKYKAALQAIADVAENQAKRDAMSWGQRMLKRDKYEALVAEGARLLIERTEKVKAYEMLRRLVAYDSTSIELTLF